MSGGSGSVAEDRVGGAVADFATWRHRLKTLGAAVSIVLGIVAGVPGFLIATDIQLAAWGYAFLLLSIPGGVLAGILVLILGAALSRQWVRARTPAAVQRIAARHEIDREKLADIASLVA